MCVFFFFTTLKIQANPKNSFVFYEQSSYTKSMFGSVIAIAFQITFRVEMHVNDVFFIFFKLFFTSAHQNDPKHIDRIKI